MSSDRHALKSRYKMVNNIYIYTCDDSRFLLEPALGVSLLLFVKNPPADGWVRIKARHKYNVSYRHVSCVSIYPSAEPTVLSLPWQQQNKQPRQTAAVACGYAWAYIYMCRPCSFERSPDCGVEVDGPGL